MKSHIYDKSQTLRFCIFLPPHSVSVLTYPLIIYRHSEIFKVCSKRSKQFHDTLTINVHHFWPISGFFSVNKNDVFYSQRALFQKDQSMFRFEKIHLGLVKLLLTSVVSS